MRKAGLLVISIASGLLLVAACSFSFHIHSKLNGIRREIQADETVAFDRMSLPSAGSSHVGPVFTPLLAGDSYTVGAVLQGSRVWLPGFATRLSAAHFFRSPG